MAGQAFFALCTINFCGFSSACRQLQNKSLQSKMKLPFFNGKVNKSRNTRVLFSAPAEMFQGIECQQAVVVAGTGRIRNFAGSLT